MKRSRSTATQDATLPLFPDYAELEELPVYDEPLLSPEWAEGGYFVASVKRYRVGDDYVAFSLMRHRRGFARASCCGILMYDLMLDMWATRSLRNRDLANRVRREQPNLDAFLSEAGLQLYITIALKHIAPDAGELDFNRNPFPSVTYDKQTKVRAVASDTTGVAHFHKCAALKCLPLHA
jgi:hypothetical protein